MLKGFLFLVLLFVFPVFKGVPQQWNAKDLLGAWLTEDGDAAVRIYWCQLKLCGKIIWLEEPKENGKPKVDDENPDPEKRDRLLMGLKILKGFEFDPEEEIWENGTIYDPKTGNTYKCYMELLSEDKLKVRGYIGFSLIGRTSYWLRLDLE